MNWFLLPAVVVHAGFMAGELLPWDSPVILRVASEKKREALPEAVRQALPEGELFTPYQKPLVATIVHNAGIYNGILAGGLLWAMFAGDPAADVACVLLIGAIAAGIFGAVTLKSPPVLVQALVGVIGLLRL
jgi:Protein of unknown function (DUF1304)